VSGPLTIGALADAAGVKRSTIRYYERQGLLQPPARSPHGYRWYDSEALERLRFIRAAQAAGFSLDHIRTLLRLRERDAAPCRQVRDLIDDRLREVERELAELHHVRRELRHARARCLAGEPRDRCAVLSSLSDRASGEGTSAPR